MFHLILNIRFAKWHLQVDERFRLRILRNDYHTTENLVQLFRVYQFGEHSY